MTPKIISCNMAIVIDKEYGTDRSFRLHVACCLLKVAGLKIFLADFRRFFAEFRRITCALRPEP